MTVKLCIDCKWSTDLGTYHNHKWACGNKKAGSYTDVVDGQFIYISCHVARSRLDGSCGREGKFWEAK